MEDNVNHVIIGESLHIGRLEYWFWSLTDTLTGRKHLFGKLYWRL